LQIFSPAADPTALESNTSSIVARLSYGEIDFMLTGDAPSSIEEYLVKTYGERLESEVLKLGHHGSKTSTAENFLLKVSPLYAVVSAGRDNRYGHPNSEVIARVEAFGSEILSTATLGTIVFKTDGERVWVE
jgi:competence protein ComEC